MQRGLESRRFRQYENCRDLVKRRNLAFFSAEFIYFIDQLRSTPVFNGVAHATLVAEENPWRKFPSERTCVTGLTKFGRVLLNLFFSGETLRWADAF